MSIVIVSRCALSTMGTYRMRSQNGNEAIRHYHSNKEDLIATSYYMTNFQGGLNENLQVHLCTFVQRYKRFAFVGMCTIPTMNAIAKQVAALLGSI